MGRREDGAAVRRRPEMCPRPHRVGQAGKPRRRLMRRRGPEANVAFGTRAMAGLRSRAIGPGARSWLTGVAGPRSRKRGPSVAERRCGAPGGAFLLTREKGDAFAKRPTGWSRRPSTGGLANPRVCRRSAPLEGAKNWNWQCGVPGADQRTRAMNRVRCLTFESVRRTRRPYSQVMRGLDPRIHDEMQRASAVLFC